MVSTAWVTGRAVGGRVHPSQKCQTPLQTYHNHEIYITTPTKFRLSTIISYCKMKACILHHALHQHAYGKKKTRIWDGMFKFSNLCLNGMTPKELARQWLHPRQNAVLQENASIFFGSRLGSNLVWIIGFELIFDSTSVVGVALEVFHLSNSNFYKLMFSLFISLHYSLWKTFMKWLKLVHSSGSNSIVYPQPGLPTVVG